MSDIKKIALEIADDYAKNSAIQDHISSVEEIFPQFYNVVFIYAFACGVEFAKFGKVKPLKDIMNNENNANNLGLDSKP